MVSNLDESQKVVYIYPTDTVWGIGVSYDDHLSNEIVRKVKQNENNKPLSLLFSSVDELLAFLNDGLLNQDFLKEFFKWESTLLIPIQFWKQKIPKSIIGESSFVGVRCLEADIFKSLNQKGKTPLTSTSLNLKGHKPISTEEDALIFRSQFIPLANILKSKELSPSGEGSSIYRLNRKNNRFQFLLIRRGRYFLKLEEVISKYYS